MATIPQMEMDFWKNIDREDDLQRLRYVIDNLDDGFLMELLEKRRGRGRNEYPVRVMWNCVLAIIVFQHQSVSGFIREMRRNIGLREAVGCDMYRGKDAVPGEHVFSRFFKLLRDFSCEVDNIFHSLVEKMFKHRGDFGKVLSVDSKAVRSFARRNSRNRKVDGRCEKDADLGVKVYETRKKNGEIVRVEKKWFGFKAHIIVDAVYELPLWYEVTRASANDSPMLKKMLKGVEEKHSDILNRCEYLTGDRGYDSMMNNSLLFDKYGITPVLDIRDMWKDGDKTRLLDPDRTGNVVYNYRGDVMCVCPVTGEMRPMCYCGYEKDRGTIKYRCPATAYGMECKGVKQCSGESRYGRIVRVPIDRDRRLFVPLPRSSYKWERIYRKRTSSERLNSRLDVSFSFENHKIRGIKKMRTMVGLTMIVMLSMAIGSIKEGRGEHIRSLVCPLRAA